MIHLMKKHVLLGLSVLTALGGMKAPAADLSSAESEPYVDSDHASALLQDLQSFRGETLPKEESSPDPDLDPSAGEASGATGFFDAPLPLNISPHLLPVALTQSIRAQVEDAARIMQRDLQMEFLQDSMDQTMFMLTGETQMEETAAEEEQTESEMPAQTGQTEETPDWPQEPAAGLPIDMPETEYLPEMPDTEAADSEEDMTETEEEESEDPGQDADGESSGEEQDASEASQEESKEESAESQTEAPSQEQTEEAEGETEQSLPDPGRGACAVPTLQAPNIARVSLYDYRMLRAYPLPILPKDLHTLYDQLEALTDTFEGEWSVYAHNLSTGQSLVLNDTALRSASVMKLFIMETVYEAFDAGTLPRTDETVSLLRNMIIVSSNEASNRLLALLGDGDLATGIEKVNQFIARHGYTPQTEIHNGFQDPATAIDPSHPNKLRARDVGLLLERVYNREFISRRVCNEIESMMLEQQTRYKIPRGLPEGVEVGNKSGETSDIANDAAIIYSPDLDYILVILSNGWANENAANENVVTLSRTVYDFFAGSE